MDTPRRGTAWRGLARVAALAAALILCSCAGTGAAGQTNAANTKEIPLSDTARVVVFGSDETSFCVTSSLLIQGKKALLIDAKFTKTDAREIVRYLQDNKLELTDIFITHGDPDYYFGLEAIKAAYPHVIAKTTPGAAQRITGTVLNKLVTWEPVLGDETPGNIILPKVVEDTSFVFEGLEIQVFGADPTRITLYLPEFQMLLAGTNVYAGYHLFLADMSSQEARDRWLNNLMELRQLDAQILIPGHSDLALETYDTRSIDFSIAYLHTVQAVLDRVQTSEEFILAMQGEYPDLKGYDVLVLSGKVLTGEMAWE